VRIGVTDERWEHGSSFHLPGLGGGESGQERNGPWGRVEQSGFWATGRGALRVLLSEIMEIPEGGRVWVPSYFCQKVTGAMADAGVELRAYLDEPGGVEAAVGEVRAGDVVLVLNTFGLRDARAVTKKLRGAGAAVIEDHSHDPLSRWAFESEADWCLASLRKTLPLPDGAVLWSPQGHRMPGDHPGESRAEAVAHRMLASMELKRMYLAGEGVEKSAFRELYKEAESSFPDVTPGGISRISRELLSAFPVDEWRERRRANWSAVCEAIGELIDGRVLEPDAAEAVPFAVVCVFESAKRRDRVREALIERRIYPAEIWPLDEPVVELPSSSVELSARTFCLQCDWRYDERDMERVVETVRAVV